MPDTEPATPAWDDQLLRDPHAVADKRSRVQKMFAAIAPSYDLNNRLHSLWMDQGWRGRALGLADLTPTDRVVDVACGTGDLALGFFHGLWLERASSTVGDGSSKSMRFSQEDWMPPRGQIVGVDFTFEMLRIASNKRISIGAGPKSHADNLTAAAKKNIVWINGDAQSLPLPDQSADIVSIAFGIRNVQDVPTALREFHRVLRPGGRVIILEFSLPTHRILRGLYNFYFRQILPRTATLISGDKTGAYKYLPESVNTFIGREQMMAMMRDAGFAEVRQFPMTFGVCVCYRGVRQ
jgi:demethylmenaquinone methyltransferase / 2-methoxy-6-polyprenyl-1,4-benzoquinol methylase